MTEPLLTVDKLKKCFPVTKGVLFERNIGQVNAVDEIDFTICPGETFGLVGESGCGKTTTAMLILQLLTPTSGAIWFEGENVTGLSSRKLKNYRRSVQAMFQDPYSSLSPRMRVGNIIAEPLIVNGIMDNKMIKDRVMEAISQVDLGRGATELYPHEFSGGQRQRIALAQALVLKPKLVVLDEPVSALDVSISAQMMNLLKDLQESLGVAYLLIAHNLATVRYMSHWVGVMYLGKIVELAIGEELFTHPLHPYTHALLSAALPSHPDVHREKIILPGEVPSPVNIPPGCCFHPRCFRAKENCSKEQPVLEEVNRQHFVACHES
ncbi:ABC transporter ATP-binding protein [Thermodesulfobacteriota bacterium]